jgi:hypothetical protein
MTMMGVLRQECHNTMTGMEVAGWINSHTAE